MGSVGESYTARVGAYATAWLFLGAAVLCGAAGFVINTAARSPSKLSKPAVLEIGGLVLVLWAVAVVLLVFAIARFSRARGAPQQERDRANARQVAAEHLGRARELVARLLAGELPDGERVWDIVLQPRERVLLDGSLAYSRFYGSSSPAIFTHVSTRHYWGVGFARIMFDHVLDHAGNRMRAEQAAFAAATRWRDQQHSRVVVTDRRLLCQIRTKEWLTFDHGAATAIKALPETRSVVLEYQGTAPVCLTGPLSVQVMVIVVWALYGADGLREHPALAEVRPALLTAPAGSAVESEAVAGSEWVVEQPAGGVQVAGREPVSVGEPVDMLVFVAAHELVLAGQIAALLETSVEEATERLDLMCERGLVSRSLLSPGSPAVYRVTAQGAAQVDPALPPLRPLDLVTRYRQAAGIAWLWASAHAGSFGEVREVLTRRQMQAADATRRTALLLNTPGATFKDAPAEGTDPAVDDAYPDLALVAPTHGWAALELVLGTPDAERLRRMIARAQRDKLIVQQLFLVEQGGHARELIEATAAELGLADRVHVQWLAEDGIADG